MDKLTEQAIRGGCGREVTYMAGRDYYRHGFVLDVKANDEGLFSVVVKGSTRYYVAVRLKEDGSVSGVRCECPAFYSYSGYCKHVVAALLAIRDQFQGFDPRRLRAAKIAEALFNLVPGPGPVIDPKLLIIEPILKHGSRNSPSRLTLGFKAGCKRLYVVKDIAEFMNCYETGQPLYFGKEFTLDSRIHGISPQDLDLLAVAREIIDVDRMNRGYGYGSIDHKDVPLPLSLLSRVVNLLKQREFILDMGNVMWTGCRVLEEDLPLGVTLSGQDRDIEVALKLKGKVEPLDRDGRLVIWEGNIHVLSPAQQRVIPPLLYVAGQSGGSKVLVPQEYRGRFASELLPLLQKGAQVEIDQELEEVFYRQPLITRVWLDAWEEGITARLEFSYGDYVFNPLEGEPPAEGDRILVRDPEGEQRLMGLLEQAEFTVRGRQFYLEDEEKLFEFVTELLPLLQEQGEVYYSEALASRRLVVSSRLKGRVGINHDTDMLEFSFDLEGIDKSELSAVLNSVREKRRYHRLKDGSFLDLHSGDMAEASMLFADLGLSRSDLQQDVLELPRYRAFAFDAYFRDGKLKSLTRNRGVRDLLHTLQEAAEADYPVPPELEGTLRDYQKTGYRWLRTLSTCNLGGILADEMGLGKTLQIIALLLAERDSFPEPALVVAPTSLIYNWKEEIARFAPTLRVRLVAGTKTEREEALADLGEVDILITSYALLRRDTDLYMDKAFGHAILDEAQYIKNPGSLTASAARDLRARRYFALTGTPIENSLVELWSVFEFLMPGFLSSYQSFSATYARGIQQDGEEGLARHLASRITPFVLRRMKRDVLPELPEKTEQRMLSELTREQKKVYLAWLEKIRGEAAQAIAADGYDRSRVKILAGLMRLRQICCHPGLFLEGYKGGSGKLDQLREVVADSLASGHRLLIFSQFTSMLGLIRRTLQEDGVECSYLDGSTPAAERLQLARAFNAGQGQVFLVSLKAGGTGLNLTGADMVVHYDLWWNPAVEDQASDRAHRIGQTRRVQVMKFVALGTIDEKIYELQQKKKALFDKVIQPGEQLLTNLSEEQVREILGI